MSDLGAWYRDLQERQPLLEMPQVKAYFFDADGNRYTILANELKWYIAGPDEKVSGVFKDMYTLHEILERCTANSCTVPVEISGDWATLCQIKDWDGCGAYDEYRLNLTTMNIERRRGGNRGKLIRGPQFQEDEGRYFYENGEWYD
jgi:hypothetical protein